MPISEALEKPEEILNPILKPDSNLTRTESIKTIEQNKKLIVTFEIIVDAKTVSSNRKVERTDQSQRLTPKIPGHIKAYARRTRKRRKANSDRMQAG